MLCLPSNPGIVVCNDRVIYGLTFRPQLQRAGGMVYRMNDSCMTGLA